MLIEKSCVIPENLNNFRLDAAAAALFPDYSRTKIQGWIESGELLLDQQEARTRDKVKTGQQIDLSAELLDLTHDLPENLELNIIFEDDFLLIINKPAGLVIHPAAGNLSGTLLNGLLYHYPSSASLPRAGIIHRLDKDTSGLLIIAKTLESQLKLSNMIKNREISRRYLALLNGCLNRNLIINAPIGRHRGDRTKMAVLAKGLGKEALTYCQILKNYSNHTLIEAKLETGRTHQIRVHLAYQKFPLLGDPLYSQRTFLPKKADPDNPLHQGPLDIIKNFSRQALCAYALEFSHPITGEILSFKIQIPEDFKAVLNSLDYFESRGINNPK